MIFLIPNVSDSLLRLVYCTKKINKKIIISFTISESEQDDIILTCMGSIVTVMVKDTQL